jgi:hypothetical protein
MSLWHVSERGDIEQFSPRLPPSPDAGVSVPVVWAVDEPRLPHYLLPRECPRVCFYALPTTTSKDSAAFFGQNTRQHVVAIASSWYERAASTGLWLYRLRASTFQCVDANAGYFVSTVAVLPEERIFVSDPLSALGQRGVELQVVDDLFALQAKVQGSTAAFSCIRMRNLVPTG